MGGEFGEVSCNFPPQLFEKESDLKHYIDGGCEKKRYPYDFEPNYWLRQQQTSPL